MINGILLLFLAYLSPGYNLTTTVVDTAYLDDGQKIEQETIKNDRELKNLKKQFGSELEIPTTYFVDEQLVLKKLDKNVIPGSVRIVNTRRGKDGVYKITYTYSKLDKPADKAQYMLLKMKPVADKKAPVELFGYDNEDPIFVNQSLDTNPSYGNIQIQPTELTFYEFFPLDKGNSWTYKYSSADKESELTSSIVSFTKGWSIFNNFFGKEKIAFMIDDEGKLLTSSKEGIKSFYNDSVTRNTVNQEVKVEAGTFNDLLIVSIPENEKFWFRDIYARNVGLIYHEHHSPKGDFYYELKKATVGGKSIQ